MSSSRRENPDSDSEPATPTAIKLDPTEVDQFTTKVELLACYRRMAKLWLELELPTYLCRGIHEYIEMNKVLESKMIRQIILLSNDDEDFEDRQEHLIPKTFEFTRLGRVWDGLKTEVDEKHVLDFDRPASSEKRARKSE
jgi:hypothetical protein